MRLREYQLKAMSDVADKGWKHKKILLVAPTGSGKTVIASALIQVALEKGHKCLFVAHRRELIMQCSKKLHDFDVNHGVIMAGKSATPRAKTQVASIQTFTIRSKKEDFIKFKKNISRQKKNLVNSYFFFHQYAPILYSLNQINSEIKKEIVKKEISVKFFQNFFFNFPDPLIIVDSNFNIVELNKQGQTLIEENAVGRNIILAMRMSGLEELLKKLLKSKKFEIGQLKTLDSPEQFFHAWASFFKRGNHNQVLLRLYDATNEKKFQSLQRDFLANASHELRTPIAAILGCCETLLGVGKSDEKIKDKFMRVIKKESSRMKSLVEDLLLLLNIERAEHSYPSGNISINELFEDLMQLAPKIYSIKHKLKFFEPK